MQQLDDVQTISKILNSCELHDKTSFRSAKNCISKTKSTFSILFNNIDGNASNFDSLLADISQYDIKFTAIAIAETNCNEESKGLYNIPGYESEYNSKITNKSKGSGLGIYIDNEFQFNRIEKFCRCTENLESLFIEVTSTETPQIIGVIYRPPSGNENTFHEEFDDLLRELPSENVHISGDYNIDLLSRGSDEFEQSIFEKNLIPTISIECSSQSSATPEKRCPKYDFCETNIAKFTLEVENEILSHGPNYNYHEHDFNGFVSFLQEKINDTFLIDENLYSNSKRNRLFNPWITNGIITSVQRKIYYYEQWKKSCCDDNKLGDEELYLRYKNFRLELRKLIKTAKKTYYHKKFKNVQGDVKKTWKLINDLRGKAKTNIKASFIINGEMVQDRREIVKEFNIYFSSIARNLNTKVYSSTLPNGQKEPGDRFSTFLDPKKRSCNSFFMSPCTKDEVADIVGGLDSGKASDIPISLLKKTLGVLLDPLFRFFNYFLNNGIFPNI